MGKSKLGEAGKMYMYMYMYVHCQEPLSLCSQYSTTLNVNQCSIGMQSLLHERF